MKAPETKPTDPAMTAEAKPEAKPETKEGMAPVAQMKPTEGLFDPNANANAAPAAPAAVPPLPGLPGATGAPRTDVRLTQAVQVPTKFGVVTINPGTPLRIISREGSWITLNHMGQPIRVPVTSTDAQ
jgi:hypothetical protein